MSRITILLLLLTLTGCTQDRSGTIVRLSGDAFGTRYVVVMHPVDPESDRVRRVEEGIDGTIDRLNDQMSTYLPESEISRFNRLPAGESLELSPEFAEVLRAALTYADRTAGALDPTIGPLVEAWGFGPGGEKRQADAPEQLAPVLAAVGTATVSLDGRILTKLVPGAAVDLNAIAKGFAVDEMAAILRREGVEHFLIEIGGEVTGQGVNPRGERWTIGIEVPTLDRASRETRRIQERIPFTGGGIATSGDYQNYFEVEGRIYPHLIDPRTGQPVQNAVASVTIIAPTAMDADAAATAVTVMGREAGLRWLEGQPELEGILFTRNPDGTFTRHQTSRAPDPLSAEGR